MIGRLGGEELLGIRGVLRSSREGEANAALARALTSFSALVRAQIVSLHEMLSFEPAAPGDAADVTRQNRREHMLTAVAETDTM